MAVTDVGVHADATARARPPALRPCSQDNDETERRQANQGAGWTHGRGLSLILRPAAV